MNHAQPSARPTRLEPLALYLRLSSGDLATVPVGPSPFAGGKGIELGMRLITPTDYWLVRTTTAVWHLRMLDPTQGQFEIRLPEGLIGHLTDIARGRASAAPAKPRHDAAPPRRRRKASRIPSTVIGLLADSRGSLAFVNLDNADEAPRLDGTVRLADEFKLSLEGPPERWTVGVKTIDRDWLIAPIPEKVGGTIREMMLQANDQR